MKTARYCRNALNSDILIHHDVLHMIAFRQGNLNMWLSVVLYDVLVKRFVTSFRD